MRARKLSEDDLRLWSAYGRTLKLLPGKALVNVPPVPAAQAVADAIPPPPKIGFAAPRIGQPPAGLDRASWRRFQVGRVRSARTLDLHGLTAAAAHRATIGFIQQAHAAGQRCVEIITGKGEILARELPFWLEAPPLRGLVLALAYPHEANTGALRVLLRRVR